MHCRMASNGLQALGAGIASLSLAALCCVPVTGSAWEQESWEVQPFSRALGGGPETGPVVEAGNGASALCGDRQGNLFLISGQYVDIVTPEGMRFHLAGTGFPGYRDGPARQAEFRFSMSSNRAHYGRHNIACAEDGTVYVADDGNNRVRRIFRSKSGWQVDTLAGGGSRKLAAGESAEPTEVDIRNRPIVAVTPDGTVYIGSRMGYFTVPKDGGKITFSGRWSDAGFSGAGKIQPSLVMADADRLGNVYYVSRGPDVVIKIPADGKPVHIGGIIHRGAKKPFHIGDGPPREVFYDSPAGMVADPDGSAVYLGGGDEYELRRNPADGSGETRTLLQNGRWGSFPKHPNNYSGPAIFTPGREKGGEQDASLKAFMIGHIIGRDYDGGIYIHLPPWRGSTQYVENSGLLPSGIFRLQRVRVD